MHGGPDIDIKESDDSKIIIDRVMNNSKSGIIPDNSWEKAFYLRKEIYEIKSRIEDDIHKENDLIEKRKVKETSV